MYGKRVSKDSPRVGAYGEVDELNACLGLARAQADKDRKGLLEVVQKALVGLMGELAVAPEDLKRYEADGYARIKEEDLRSAPARKPLSRNPRSRRGVRTSNPKR